MATQPKRTVNVELWVLIDEDGDYVVSDDPDTLTERYQEQITESLDRGLRRVKVVLTVPLPTVSVLTGTVPAEGDATLSVEGGDA